MEEEVDAFGEDFGSDDFGSDDFGGDDFGGDEFGEEVADEEPVEQEAPAEGEAEEDDLFGGFGAILNEPGGYLSADARSWVDNTGQFSCVARLVAVEGGSVKLLKINGKTATAPLSRLSQSDLLFVNRQALAQFAALEHEAEVLRTAQR